MAWGKGLIVEMSYLQKSNQIASIWSIQSIEWGLDEAPQDVTKGHVSDTIKDNELRSK